MVIIMMLKRGEKVLIEFSISQPLYQQIYTKFKQAILAGEWKPGEKIIVTKLANQFSISRTPLREALRQLQIEGLLVNEESGLHVIKLDAHNFKELYQCRIVLEKEVMQMVVETISDEQLKDAEKMLEQADRALEEQAFLRLLELNTEFHGKLLESAPNRRALELLQRIRNFLLIYRAEMLRSAHFNYGINREHKEIFTALTERDKNKVADLIEMHLKNDEQRGLEIFLETPD